MESSWQRQYGSRNPFEEADDFQAIYRSAAYERRALDPNDLPKRATRCWVITASVILVAAVVTVLTLGVTMSDETGGLDFSQQTSMVASSNTLSAAKACSQPRIVITASNEYGVYSGPYPYMQEPNTMLVEPYKDTTLSMNKQGDCGYRSFLWEIRAPDGKIVFSATTIALTTKIRLKYTGKYALTVSTALTGGRKGSRTNLYTGVIYCKYVKRELRQLTLADKNRFLDAAIVLWKTDTLTGRKMYGPQYTSIATFVEEHALASNDIRCDGYHEGTGFLTHHLALENSFDASVRAVDPTVTTPYWDFSIEGEKIYQAGKPPSYLLQISTIYTDEWFGSSDKNDRIVDSRWAHVAMPKVSKMSVVRPNSYGYVRSYWNNNNDPEVTRHLFDVCGVEPTFKTIPACADHYGVISSSTLGGFQQSSPGHGHGPLHVQTGGVGGDCIAGYAQFVDKYRSILYANISDEEIKSKGLEVKKVRRFGNPPRKQMLDRIVMGEYFHIYRSLWRSHMCSRDSTPELLRCPERCRQETPSNRCACAVPGLKEGTIDWRDPYNCVVNEDKRKYFDAFFTEDMLRDLVVFVGTTPLVEGDMLEAASPADIMFWMIHPAIERLLAAKRLKTVHNFGDQPMGKWSPSEEQWLEYSYYTQAAGENPTFPEAYTCVGHAANDRVLPDDVPFLKRMQTRADANGDGVVTNWEFYQAIDPNDPDGVDYVFDNFQWDQCKTQLAAEDTGGDEGHDDGPDS